MVRWPEVAAGAKPLLPLAHCKGQPGIGGYARLSVVHCASAGECHPRACLAGETRSLADSSRPLHVVQLSGLPGSAEATPLQSPPKLDDRLGLPQRTAGDLFESFQTVAHGVGVYVEVLRGQIDAAIIGQVALGRG